MSDVCIVCDKRNPSFSWTDTHGVAQCRTCGTPYLIYHYENDARIEKPPLPCVKTEYVPVLRAYHQEVGQYIPSGHSFSGGQELASASDHHAFNDWMKANADKYLTVEAVNNMTADELSLLPPSENDGEADAEFRQREPRIVPTGAIPKETS